MDNAIDIKRAMDFMKGDNAVFNTKLQNAQTKGQTLATVGDLLSMASMLTGMGAMMAPAGTASAAGAKGASTAASVPTAKTTAAGFFEPISLYRTPPPIL